MVRRFVLSMALALSLAFSVLTPAGAADDDGTSGPPPQNLPTYTIDQATLPFDALPGTTTTRQWGVLDGAGYQIEVPANWNGELVMWAHGFAGYGAELSVSPPPMRAWLVANGFAWAASSYSQNGYVVEQGARDTLKLAKRFAKLHRKPTRQYLTGASMGGHITGYSIEKNHGFYDGAMPVCGVMGDRELFDYFQSFHLVAGAITGITTPYPAAADYPLTTVPALKAALGGPTGAGYQQLAAVTQQLSGGTRVGFAVGYAVWFDFLMTLGAPPPGVAAFPSDNRRSVYQLDGDPALTPAESALNALGAAGPPARLPDRPTACGRSQGDGPDRHPGADHAHRWRPVRAVLDAAVLRPQSRERRVERSAGPARHPGRGPLQLRRSGAQQGHGRPRRLGPGRRQAGRRRRRQRPGQPKLWLHVLRRHRSVQGHRGPSRVPALPAPPPNARRIAKPQPD